MSGKNNLAKVDDSLGTNHLAVYCDVGQLIFEPGFFELVTPGVDSICCCFQPP